MFGKLPQIPFVLPPVPSVFPKHCHGGIPNGDGSFGGGNNSSDFGTDCWIYTQKKPSAEWNVQHDLGTWRPIVYTFDADGKPVNVFWEVVDKDHIRVKPAVSFSGVAIIYKTSSDDEKEPVVLTEPTLGVFQGEGVFQLKYTIPDDAISIIIQYDTNPTFTNPQSLECFGAGIVLEPLQGTYYFRAQSQGMIGSSKDSPWTSPIMFTFAEPVNVSYVDTAPVSIVQGDDVNLLDMCSILGENAELHYLVSEVGTQEQDGVDVSSSSVPVGIRTVSYFVVFDGETLTNTVTRAFNVTPPLLPAPVITIVSVAGQSVKLGGLVSNAAVGWRVKVDNTAPINAVATVEGYYTVTGLNDVTAHEFKAQAVGDGVNFGDSPWSDPVKAVTTNGVYSILTDYYAADRRKARQNCVFCAQIIDRETRVLLDSSAVSCIKMTVFKQSPFGGRVAIKPFVDVPVEKTTLYNSLQPCVYWNRDHRGCNFIYVPDQKNGFIFNERGVFDVEVTFVIPRGNPVVAKWQVNIL